MAETNTDTYPVLTTQTFTDAAVTYSNANELQSHRGIVVMVDITANSGTSPTLTVALEEYYPGGNAGAGRWVALSAASTGAIDATAVTNQRLIVYPGVTASANAAVNSPVAERWRVSATVGGSGSPTVTGSVHVTKIP